MRLFDVVGTWLPVAAVALAALAVWTAPAHRVALMTAAIGIGVMMIVLLVGLAVIRRVHLDSVPPTALPEDAAAAVFDAFVCFLRESTRTLLVIAVITALAACLYGPAAAPAPYAPPRPGVPEPPAGPWPAPACAPPASAAGWTSTAAGPPAW